MPDSCRTSPNPGVRQAFLDNTVCTLTCTLSYTISKTGDRLILRPFSQDSPGSASTGGPPSEKSQKQFVLATQNPDSGRELTESNLLSEFVEQKSTDCTVLKLDNPRISLDRKSGQAISDHETFRKPVWQLRTRDNLRTILPPKEELQSHWQYQEVACDS